MLPIYNTGFMHKQRIKVANYHTHAPNSARVNAQTVINTIKERCIKETTPIPTIYDEERTQLSSAD
jgi:hypothetical protein